MPPLDATENRVLDAVLARIQTIGTPASQWLTQPSVAEGTPFDAIDKIVKPLIYLEHDRTDIETNNLTTASHGARVSMNVWLVAKDHRTVNRLKADVLRAVFGGEAALEAALRQPVYPMEFLIRNDMRSVGRIVGQLGLYVDVLVSHSDP